MPALSEALTTQNNSTSEQGEIEGFTDLRHKQGSPSEFFKAFRNSRLCSHAAKVNSWEGETCLSYYNGYFEP